MRPVTTGQQTIDRIVGVWQAIGNRKNWQIIATRMTNKQNQPICAQAIQLNLQISLDDYQVSCARASRRRRLLLLVNKCI